jgi:hypothetical protein
MCFASKLFYAYGGILQGQIGMFFASKEFLKSQKSKSLSLGEFPKAKEQLYHVPAPSLDSGIQNSLL